MIFYSEFNHFNPMLYQFFILFSQDSLLKQNGYKFQKVEQHLGCCDVLDSDNIVFGVDGTLPEFVGLW